MSSKSGAQKQVREDLSKTEHPASQVLVTRSVEEFDFLRLGNIPIHDKIPWVEPESKHQINLFQIRRITQPSEGNFT